jgi:hypothetical protein
MTKTLNPIIFFSSTKIRIFFSATVIGNQNIFLEKNLLFLIICLAYGVYFLSQLSEKGYRFLLGLFFKIWGLEALVRQQSEMGSKLVLAMK